MLKRLLKMNLNLVRFLLKETTKQQTLRGVVIFFKKIAIQYFRVHLQEYKNLFLIFDADYQKAKKDYEKNQEVKKALQTALRMLQYVDKKMVQAGKSRQQRRMFWRDFYKQGEVRNQMFEDLGKEINQIRG